MTDSYRFLLSALPQIISQHFIQETEALVVSFQKHLELLQKDLSGSATKTDIILELTQDADLLNQIQVSRKSFLNEYKANFLRKSEEPDSGAEISSLELLEAFVHESRHAVASIQGCVGLLQTIDEDRWEEIVSIFTRVLYLLKSMCEQFQEWQK